MTRDQLIAAGIIKPVSPEVEEQHKKDERDSLFMLVFLCAEIVFFFSYALGCFVLYT